MQTIALLTTYPAEAFPAGVPKIKDFTVITVTVAPESVLIEL